MRRGKKESPVQCWDARRRLGRCHECDHVQACRLPGSELGRKKAREIELEEARKEFTRAEERLRRAQEV